MPIDLVIIKILKTPWLLKNTSKSKWIKIWYSYWLFAFAEQDIDNEFIACQNGKKLIILEFVQSKNYVCQVYQPQDNGSKNDWVHIRFRGQAAHYSWENEPQNSP